MVDFYKQALSAQSRGVLDTFTYHVLASRHWGKDHKESDTSLVTIQKTTRQFLSWNHQYHFQGFALRSRDHHDLLHNGILAMVLSLENIKTSLMSGLSIHGCTANTPFPWPRPSAVPPSFIAVLAYISIWNRKSRNKNKKYRRKFKGRV